jgi:hypothetical protein
MIAPFVLEAKPGFGYTAKFKFLDNAWTVEWAPCEPVIGPRHRREFFEKYLAARDDFFEIVATLMGSEVVVVGITSDGETSYEIWRPGMLQ